MRLALVNPPWSFEGSIYFGCREAHLPLELGYSKALLEQAGHEAVIIDAHLLGLSHAELRRQVADFAPDTTVVTTAPSYLFWRCAPPELRVPQAVIDEIRDVAGRVVAVGPHGSTTPRAALDKLAADVVVMGECEEIVARLADQPVDTVPSVCYRQRGDMVVRGGPHAADFGRLPALSWPAEWVARHHHHHHRFDSHPAVPGAEVEASRGCPYHCSFCAKENFRNRYRRRDLDALLAEIDGLIAQGARYVYFVDEIFLPDRRLLEAVRERDVRFGVQTRIDLWKPEMIDLLGEAGCVSIEAGVESITRDGREALDKNCRLDTEELTERLLHAKQRVAFVQANLIETASDDVEAVRAWRDRVRAAGVWANDPVPLFPYPGSPDYRKLWGLPDDHAWERALDYYLDHFVDFSDLQEEQPLPLSMLERPRRAAE